MRIVKKQYWGGSIKGFKKVWGTMYAQQKVCKHRAVRKTAKVLWGGSHVGRTGTRWRVHRSQMTRPQGCSLRAKTLERRRNGGGGECGGLYPLRKVALDKLSLRGGELLGNGGETGPQQETFTRKKKLPQVEHKERKKKTGKSSNKWTL